MYSLIRTSGLRLALERELIPFAAALLIAQIYFKWGSFTLELIGFIALWFALGFIAERIRNVISRR